MNEHGVPVQVGVSVNVFVPVQFIVSTFASYPVLHINVHSAASTANVLSHVELVRSMLGVETPAQVWATKEMIVACSTERASRGAGRFIFQRVSDRAGSFSKTKEFSGVPSFRWT